MGGSGDVHERSRGDRGRDRGRRIWQPSGIESRRVTGALTHDSPGGHRPPNSTGQLRVHRQLNAIRRRQPAATLRARYLDRPESPCQAHDHGRGDPVRATRYRVCPYSRACGSRRSPMAASYTPMWTCVVTSRPPRPVQQVIEMVAGDVWRGQRTPRAVPGAGSPAVPGLTGWSPRPCNRRMGVLMGNMVARSSVQVILRCAQVGHVRDVQGVVSTLRRTGFTSEEPRSGSGGTHRQVRREVPAEPGTEQCVAAGEADQVRWAVGRRRRVGNRRGRSRRIPQEAVRLLRPGGAWSR